eukprot:TRINITY_DN18338_c0_g1_i5.p1 TRINITY_DN18338_c0_g1~~TRINITY_DN18338_c0_g1_i5.p1  ORF type:complete len:226 (+),score=-10.39 TRINITY_DN18338_c0_g1_i5:176-853(+)
MACQERQNLSHTHIIRSRNNIHLLDICDNFFRQLSNVLPSYYTLFHPSSPYFSGVTFRLAYTEKALGLENSLPSNSILPSLISVAACIYPLQFTTNFLSPGISKFASIKCFKVTPFALAELVLKGFQFFQVFFTVSTVPFFDADLLGVLAGYYFSVSLSIYCVEKTLLRFGVGPVSVVLYHKQGVSIRDQKTSETQKMKEKVVNDCYNRSKPFDPVIIVVQLRHL